MRIHDLRPAVGSVKNRKRVGRGRSSGLGKTSGRGQKGQLSRSGGGKGPGFEGGQNPLQRRLPKLPGFKNRFKKIYAIVNVSGLDTFVGGDVVDAEILAVKGLIKKSGLPLKILGNGELTKKLTVRTQAVTKSARAKIETVGGRIEIITVNNSRVDKPKTASSKVNREKKAK